MSIRERPVANRFLDIQDKHCSYRKHVSALYRSRPTVNTVQPDTPLRLQVSAMASDRHRRGLMRAYIDAGRVAVGASRPGTTKSRRGTGVSETYEYETAYQRQGSRAEPRILPRDPLTPPPKKSVSVRIGYREHPIVTEEAEGS
jgi:hypothetical protein